MPANPSKPRKGKPPQDKDEEKQQPPPELGSGSDVPWKHKGDDDDDHDPKHPHYHHHLDKHAAEAIYAQLLALRETTEKLLQEAREAKLRRRLELVPVRTADLMRGFQAAVAKANRSTRAGEQEGEDIERMAIKDLEVSLTAPIIESAHAEDPVVMLPNIKSVDADSPSLSLKFSVVSVPRQSRG